MNSVVSDLIMPLISLVTGGIDFSIRQKIPLGAGSAMRPTDFTYGNFIRAIIQFLIIALVVFLYRAEGLQWARVPRRRQAKALYRKAGHEMPLPASGEVNGAPAARTAAELPPRHDGPESGRQKRETRLNGQAPHLPRRSRRRMKESRRVPAIAYRQDSRFSPWRSCSGRRTLPGFV